MSDKIEDGGCAFPVPEGEANCVRYGMTLRDWFAGQALAAVLAAVPKDAQPRALEDIAWSCYAIADAMLKERS